MNNQFLKNLVRYLILFDNEKTELIEQTNTENDIFAPENFGYVLIYLTSLQPTVAGELFQNFLQLFLSENGIDCKLAPPQAKYDIEILDKKYQIKFLSLYKSKLKSPYITYDFGKTITSRAISEVQENTRRLTKFILSKTKNISNITELNLLNWLSENEVKEDIFIVLNLLIDNMNKFLIDFKDYFTQDFIVGRSRRRGDNIEIEFHIISFKNYLSKMLEHKFIAEDLFFKKEENIITFSLKKDNYNFDFRTTPISEDQFKLLYGVFREENKRIFDISNMSIIHFYYETLLEHSIEDINIRDFGKQLIDFILSDEVIFSKRFGYPCIRIDNIRILKDQYTVIVRLVRDVGLCEPFK